MNFKVIIFDFDGTLTSKCNIDFSRIRQETGCPEGHYLLDYFETLPVEEKKKAINYLHDQEFRAAAESQAEDFAEELIEILKAKEIKSVIISRNSRCSVERALENFEKIQPGDFYRIITRDDPFPVKPDPAAMIFIAEELNVELQQILVVGDYIHDMEAGIRAGCRTAYKLTGRDNDDKIISDFRIKSLTEILSLV